MFLPPRLTNTLIAFHTSTTHLWRFNVADSNKSYTGLSVQFPLLFRIVTNYGLSGRILMNVCPMEPKWYMRKDTDRQMDRQTERQRDRQTADRQTDRMAGMMKALGPFRKYAKASKKRSVNAVQESIHWGLGIVEALLMKTLTEISAVHCEHNTKHLNRV